MREEVVMSLGPMQPEEDSEKSPWEHLRETLPPEDKRTNPLSFPLRRLPSLCKESGWLGFSCVTSSISQARSQ